MDMRPLLLLILASACSGISSDPGRGELVAYDTLSPTWLTLSGNNLYYTSASLSGDYFVQRVYKLGGTPELIVATGVIDALTGDDHGVYWVDLDDHAVEHVKAWSQGDTAPRDLGANPNGFNGATYRNIVTDGDAVYYADYTGTVWKAPVT